MSFNLIIFCIIISSCAVWFTVGYRYGRYVERRKKYFSNEKRTVFRKN